MQKNVGTADRIVRIVLAALIAALLATKVVTGTIAVILAIAAVILLFTGFIGWCGLYTVFGINTKTCCGNSPEGKEDSCCCCGHEEEPKEMK